MSVVLTIDSREKIRNDDIIKEWIENTPIDKKEYIIKENQLQFGDFLIETPTIKIAIERKTLTDLRASFIDNKLHSQLSKLLLLRENNIVNELILLVEGNFPDNLNEFSRGKLSYLNLYNIIESYRLMGFRILKTSSSKDTYITLFCEMHFAYKRFLKSSQTAGKEKSVEEKTSNAMANHLITKTSKIMPIIEDWMYLPLYLALFKGITFERAKIISPLFNDSIGVLAWHVNYREDETREKLKGTNSPHYKKAISSQTIEKIIKCLKFP
jgi:ERCC4-type nuclease